MIQSNLTAAPAPEVERCEEVVEKTGLDRRAIAGAPAGVVALTAAEAVVRHLNIDRAL